MKMLNLGRFALAVSGLAVAVAMPAHAQLATNTFATQAEITVVPTTVESSARGSSIAISGNNVTVAGLGSITNVGVITAPGAASVTTAGSAFTYNVSVVDEDTVADPVLASGTVTTLPEYSTQTTQVGGVAGSATVSALSSGVATALIGDGVGTTVSVLQQASLSVFK